MVYPVGQLLGLRFFTPQGQPTLEHYGKLFSSDVYVRVLWITIKISALTTLAAVLLAYPVAFVIAAAKDKTKAWLYFLVLIPFWTSFLVRAFAWMVLLGRNGTVNSFAQSLGLVDAPMSLIYNLFGALVGTTHALLPMAIIMVSVMEGIDRTLSKAATVMGAGPGSAFWRVFFRLRCRGQRRRRCSCFSPAWASSSRRRFSVVVRDRDNAGHHRADSGIFELAVRGCRLGPAAGFGHRRILALRSRRRRFRLLGRNRVDRRNAGG